MTHKLAAVIAVSCCLPGFARFAYGDYVVLETSASSINRGDLIDDRSPLTLESGERIVLMSDSGDILEMEGPSKGIPEGEKLENFNIREALRKLIDTPTELHTSLGSTRNIELISRGQELRPIWHLDPFASGTQCARAGSAVQFWRAETDNALSMVVQRPGISGSGPLEWQIDQHTSNWPKEIVLSNEELYVVRRPGWTESAMIRIVILPEPVIDNREATIAWLAVNGCKRQARAISDDNQ